MFEQIAIMITTLYVVCVAKMDKPTNNKERWERFSELCATLLLVWFLCNIEFLFKNFCN